jgi:hypothetical protein
MNSLNSCLPRLVPYAIEWRREALGYDAPRGRDLASDAVVIPHKISTQAGDGSRAVVWR